MILFKVFLNVFSDYYLFTDLQVLIDMAFIEMANKSAHLLPTEVGWKDNLDVVSCQKTLVATFILHSMRVLLLRC